MSGQVLWITLDEMEWTEGYGISGAAAWHETWSLQTRGKVDLWSWSDAAGGTWRHAESGQQFQPSAGLQKVLRRFLDGENECMEKDAGFGAPNLAASGSAFSTGNGPCLRTALVPFRDLRPFLKQEALAEIKLFPGTQ